MRSRRLFPVSMALAAMAGAAAGAEEASPWVESARRLFVPDHAARADRVVLLEESMMDVGRSETRMRVREAVRINKEGGLRQPLMAGQRTGEDFKLVAAWKVRPDGVATTYDRKSIVQIDPDGSYQFSMTKLNTLRPDELHVGDVVAWEYLTRFKPESHVVSWSFGGRSPVLRSRLGLKIPPDWIQKRHLIGMADLPGARDDEGYTVWEMRDLEALPDEPSRPADIDLLPRVVVAYSPPDRKAADGSRNTWEDLARWYAGVASSQVVSDAALKKAAAEVSGQAGDGMERVRAIARFTQSLRYLDTAVGRSVAEPHPAPEILKNRFGDCEDKAILTIAMLREIGVEAFPMLARTRSAGSVHPDQPGVGSFNHAVVAIRLEEGAASMPAALDAGPLGRLLVFDPTDSHTGLGDLPSSLQSTLALVAHPEMGRLVSLPALDPSLSSRTSEVKLSLDAAGQMQVQAEVVYLGQYAAQERWHFGIVRAEKRREEVATRLGRHHGKVEVRRLDLTALEQVGEPLGLKLDLTMKPPGKTAGSLRMMPIEFLLPTRAETLPAGERRTPLELEGGYREAGITRFTLPEGLTVESDLPAVDLSSDAGTYRLAARMEQGALVAERELVVRPLRVDPPGYPAVRKFFDEVARADASTVVLKKGS